MKGIDHDQTLSAGISVGNQDPKDPETCLQCFFVDSMSSWGFLAISSKDARLKESVTEQPLGRRFRAA
jgi:hypothetical protein